MSLFEEFLIASCYAYKKVPTTQWAALRASWRCWQLAGPGPIGSCLQAAAPPITFGSNVFVKCKWEEAQEICCGKKRDQSLWNWKKKKEKLRFMVFIAPYPASEYFPVSIKEIMVMAYCLSLSTLWTLLVCFEFYVIVLAPFHTFSSLYIKVQSVWLNLT